MSDDSLIAALFAEHATHAQVPQVHTSFFDWAAISHWCDDTVWEWDEMLFWQSSEVAVLNPAFRAACEKAERNRLRAAVQKRDPKATIVVASMSLDDALTRNDLLTVLEKGLQPLVSLMDDPCAQPGIERLVAVLADKKSTRLDVFTALVAARYWYTEGQPNY